MSRLKPIFYVFIFIIQTLFADDCAQSIFVIEQSGFVGGKVISANSDSLLDDCVKECARRENCGGANFIVDLHERPTCLLMDVRKKAHGSETPNGGNVMYAAQRICTSLKAERKHCINYSPWSFEKFSQYNLKNESFVVDSLRDVDVGECLHACGQREECAAAIFLSAKRLCKLSRVSLQNVNSARQYFEFDASADLYESNCVRKSYDAEHCSFMRVNHAGFTDFYDARIRTPSKNACEEKCLETMHFSPTIRTRSGASASLCRAYTYDAQTRFCYISHTSQRSAFGRNVLDNLHAELSYGDLENCIQFNLECMARSLILKGSSLKLFHGLIRSSSQNESVSCERQISESHEFAAEFSFRDCGLDKKADPLPVYSSMLVVKEGTTSLITFHDKMIQVSCRLNQQQSRNKAEFDTGALAQFQNRTMLSIPRISHGALVNLVPSSPLLSDGEIVDEILRHSERMRAAAELRPKYGLEVLDRVGKTATVVDINDIGYLQITMNENNEKDTIVDNNYNRFFVVTDLIAESVSENKSVVLIDSSGCVANADLVKSLRRVGRNKLQIEILFGGFQDQSRVTYQTLVKRCSFSCFAECNRKFFEKDPHFLEYYGPNPTSENSISDAQRMRSKRAISVGDASAERGGIRRHFELSEELHELSSQVMRLKLKQAQHDVKHGLALDKSAQLINERNAAQSDKEIWQEEQVVREELPSEFWRCARDANCLTTVLFVALQFLLLASCVFVVLVCVKTTIDRVRYGATTATVVSSALTDEKMKRKKLNADDAANKRLAAESKNQKIITNLQ